MDHDYHRGLQREVLDQVMTILKADRGVLGIVKAGSLARGSTDAFSDLDVGCFLREEERSSRKRLYDAVAAIGPLLCRLWIYDLNALYLFESGVRLDLDFLRPSDLAKAGYSYIDAAIEYDPDGALAKALDGLRTPRAAPHPKWYEPGDQAMVDWVFRQIVCWAKRGAQGDHRSFDKLTNAVGCLAEVRTRLVEMRLWTLGTQDYLTRADPAFAERIALTHPHLDPREIIECVRLLVDEYEYVCPPYCRKSGAVYPAPRVEIIRRLIDEFDALE